MGSLVLGPLLRYVGEGNAVIWVETSDACEVEILGTRERTFCVCGHHYALVCCDDLEPGTWHEYEVRLDGERVWPVDDGFPASAFRTYPKEHALDIVFGSCRVAAPHTPPYSLRKDEDERGREIDALHTLAHRMRNQPRDEWPDVLLMIGDQVYADEVSPSTRSFIETQRDPGEEPGERVVDFEEYTQLYRESWGDPTIRWLLSTLSTAMIFDDHDVHDDWNISQAWIEEMRQKDWWNRHILGALASYWVYQHLGNLAPEAHREDELLKRVKAAEDAEPILEEFARRADRETSGTRWSYCRDLGRTRLIVIDSRAGRQLEEGARSMLDEEEWQWLEDHVSGDFDHLLLATSLPWLLGRGMHFAEAWSEAVAAGGWGEAFMPVAERLRRAIDLEHWAAFGESFARLAEIIRSVGAGERGRPPASIVVLSGDVHHAYLFEVAFPRGSGVKSHVWQAVCSPYRNPLEKKERRVIRVGMSRPFEVVWRALAHTAGVEDPAVQWRMVGDGPWFDNQVAGLTIDGREIEMRLDKAVPVDTDSARLERVLEHRLA
ncbi:MAG TPA: alkaline phosphatase D family protein [Thermoleophilaceae bacterium]|nr:alkaline phosphatase D family protein [Thermoleophilaceae bacterium]